MTELDTSGEVFQHLVRAFIREQGYDLAESYKAGGLARPSDEFSEVFVWLWETDHEDAMHILAQLLHTARAHCEPDDKISVERLLEDLRYSLHRTRYAREYEYSDIKDMGVREIPELLPDLND